VEFWFPASTIPTTAVRPSLVDSVCTELFWKLSGCGDFSFCNQNHHFFMDSGQWPWWLLCASAGRSSG
jgi:hypothetical protein